MAEVWSIGDVPIEFPQRANYESLLHSFLAVYAMVQGLEERLARLETQLLEERFSLPAAEGGDDA
jgi:hypothetical protein